MPYDKHDPVYKMFQSDTVSDSDNTADSTADATISTADDKTLSDTDTASQTTDKSGKPIKKKNFFIKYLAVWIILLVGAGIIIGVILYNSAPLDEIQLYEVNAQMQPDGTMNNTYHIKWKVLNDSREGPLTWVRIGMPNMNYEVVSNYGAAVSAYNNNDGYIQITLDEAYYKDQTADFTFTVTQNDMLCISDGGSGTNNDYMVDFAPGWFPKIKVDSYKFTLTPALGAVSGNQDSIEGNMLVWSGSLAPNGHREMKVYYPASAFANAVPVAWTPIDYSSNTDNGSGSTDIGALIIPIIFIAISLISTITNISRGGYRGGRGFYGGFYGGGFRGGMGGFGGGCAGCACAGCACACACAGGGRAGCNTKGFYTSSISKNEK